MKFLCLCWLLILFPVFSFSQSKDQVAVSKAVEQLRKAMIDADKVALENAVSDSLSYGHSSGRVENKTTFIENILNGNSDFITIDLSEQTIAVSHHVAVVRHLFVASTNDKGVPGNISLKILLVWVKEKGKWKLIARQAVKAV